MIYGNAVMAPTALKTVTLEDANGNSYTGVVTGEQVILTANPSDIKIGKTAAIDGGIVEGTDTKTYRTTHGTQSILPGESFTILLDKYDGYDYTKFQAVIAEFNTTSTDSTSVVKISLNDAVYNVNSTTKISNITKNSLTKSIDFNITNDTNNIYVIHYITFREE